MQYDNGKGHMESVILQWLSHGECDTNMAKVTWTVWYKYG